MLNLSEWGTRHDLTSDDGKPLKITVNRIKTTVEVRTTKAMGGHLPSASRTNTLDVSFQHYLQGDPVVRAWAEEIMTTALEEAESTARQFKPRVLDTATEQALRDGSRTADSLGITPRPSPRPWTASATPSPTPAWTSSTARSTKAAAECRS